MNNKHLQFTDLLSAKLLLISFFFVISCSSPQSRVFPEDEFFRLKESEVFPFSSDKIDPQMGTSVIARVTLSRLLVKHIVSLSTVYLPPDSFRVDIFSTGLPKLLFLVARSQEVVQLVVPSENTIYVGDSGSRPLTKVIGFPLPELYLLKLLLGQSEIPANSEFIEHSKRSIFRVESKEESGFRYRLYFEKIGCLEQDISAEKFKLSGLEVLSENGEYLFFAKAKFEDKVKNCSESFPSHISFENFNTRFTGSINNIQVRNQLSFNSEERTRLFSPAFPSYVVRSLANSDIGDKED